MKAKTKRIISLLLCVLMISGVMAVGLISVNAEVNNAVRDDSNGIFQLNAKIYVSGTVKDSDGKEMKLEEELVDGGSGTVFLINNTTVLTCDHVVNWKKELKQYEAMGLRAKVVYELVVNKDVVIPCTYKNGSEQDDYAILTLSQPLGGKKILKLGDSSKAVQTQRVYALGFPGTITEIQITADSPNVTYDKDDVTITEGTIQKVTSINNTDVIQHGCVTSGGNSGGPLVDEDGYVLGVHKWGAGDDNAYHYATAINEIKKVLDSLMITYYGPDDPDPTGSEEDDTVVPQTTADKSSVVESSSKTELPSDITISGVDGQVSDNKSGGNSTGEAKESDNSNLMMIIIIAIAVLVVVIVAVVLIILLTGKKKKAAPPTPTPPVPPVQPPVVPRPPVYNDGAGETSVLNDGAAETTVLGGQNAGYLIVRKRNGERISIGKSEFLIGKERRRVDYCISDNNSVSRIHARIRVRNGRCYISDMGSTNCTYVNGTKLSPNQEVVLSRGDKIKVSDEEFEFMG